MSTPRVIKLAITALGGQGGGVLSGWVGEVARAAGWHAQATSVPGVAQRTGATIYYIEMAEPTAKGAPVLALSPAPGDVDIVLAAEMMEAGRAIQRGFVTPDRTVLIGSTHRAYATVEKIVPGDGRGAADEVTAAAEVAAKRAILLDLDRLAAEAGSVISASLFGALAASGALPFPRAEFEAVIRNSGRGVAASLAAFAAAWEAVEQGQAATDAPDTPPAEAQPQGPARALADWSGLTARADALPGPVAAMARHGLRRVVDFQDCAYGRAYLDRLDRAVALDDASRGWRLAEAAAKYLAVAMAYDDVIRVADLKTRPGRIARIAAEMGAGADQAMTLTEYMHPRAAEIVGLFPARLGAWAEARPRLMAWLDRRVNRGRRLRSAALSGFVPLWLLAGLRPWRRRLYRHAVEEAHLARWYDLALDTAARDHDLGGEVLACRRLIKGYSDTHARGLSKFDRVLGALPLLEGRTDAADWLRRLRTAALQDPDGKALDGALATVQSFTARAA